MCNIVEIIKNNNGSFLYYCCTENIEDYRPELIKIMMDHSKDQEIRKKAESDYKTLSESIKKIKSSKSKI
jgi:hypothetical protein